MADSLYTTSLTLGPQTPPSSLPPAPAGPEGVCSGALGLVCVSGRALPALNPFRVNTGRCFPLGLGLLERTVPWPRALPEEI